MSALSAKALQSRLRARTIGCRIHCKDRVASTNDEAWALAVEGAPDGTCVFAEEQTGGRGRLGRTWHSPRGAGLYLSLLLRRAIPLERVPLVTAVAALAGVEAVEAAAGLVPRIRFPNDLVVNGRKLAGVLVESRFISSRPDLFIIGFGLNVNQGEFPGELREIATSLRIEKGGEVDRTAVARALLEALDRGCDALEGPLPPIRRLWRRHAEILGRDVRVRLNGKSISGRVDEVDPVDGLLLRLPGGEVRSVRSEHVERLELV